MNPNVDRIVAIRNVVIPGVMERLGLAYESLAQDNPRLIYAALRGFGDSRSGDSPYNSWPAFDVVIQAMAGIMGITGTDTGQPIKVGPGVGDIFPGTMLALGIVSALFEARASGRASSSTSPCTTRCCHCVSGLSISIPTPGSCLDRRATVIRCSARSTCSRPPTAGWRSQRRMTIDGNGFAI